MFLRKFISVSILFFALFGVTAALAANNSFNCVMTITKPQDWQNQTVIINLLDFETKQIITRFELAAADPDAKKQSINSVTKTFDCGMYPETQLQAYYFPIIWSANKGKKYLSKEIFRLSAQIEAAEKSKAKNLEIEVSFPDDFSNVPLQVGL